MKINVTLIVEADIEKTSNDPGDFIRQMLTGTGEQLSPVEYHINKMQQEAEIYAPDPGRDRGIWEFVEKYYPKLQ